MADKGEVQLAYAVGVAQPVSIMIDTFGTGKYDETKIANAVMNVFNLTPDGIIDLLDLRNTSYQPLAAYGHMGREDLPIKWEKTDKVEALLDALNQ